MLMSSATLILHEDRIRADIFAVDSFDVDGKDRQSYGTGALLNQAPRTLPGWSKRPKWRGTATNIGTDPEGFSGSAREYPSSGARAWFDPTGINSFRYLYRPLDEPVSEESIVVSYVLHTGWDFLPEADAAEFVLIGFVGIADLEQDSEREFEGIGGPMVGFVGHLPDRRIDLAVRSRDGNKPAVWRTLKEDVRMGSHQLILKIDRSSSEKREKVSFWLDPWSIESEVRASETSQASGHFFVDCIGDNEELTGFLVAAKAWDRKFFFDEIRLGSSWESLTASSSHSPARRWIAGAAIIALLVVAIRRIVTNRSLSQ
jgi:hypothetical protein